MRRWYKQIEPFHSISVSKLTPAYSTAQFFHVKVGNQILGGFGWERQKREDNFRRREESSQDETMLFVYQSQHLSLLDLINQKQLLLFSK